MKKVILFAVLAFSLVSCSSKKQEPKYFITQDLSYYGGVKVISTYVMRENEYGAEAIYSHNFFDWTEDSVLIFKASEKKLAMKVLKEFEEFNK